MNIPEKLYHYTSVSTLKLIIESKKIRLNRLDKVDDITEGQTKDFINLAKYVFVSCWTDDPEENIPMWSMYSKDMSGVRIELKSDFLKEHYHFSCPERGIYVDGEVKLVVAQKELHGNGYHVWPVPGRYPLYKVQYTNNDDELKPKVMGNHEQYISLASDKVGVFKSKEWAFQNEWRVKLIIFPAPPPPPSYAIPGFADLMNPLPRVKAGENLPINNFDLEIDEIALKSMRILLGPRIDDKKRKNLESFIKKEAPYIKIVDSKLKGKIRT